MMEITEEKFRELVGEAIALTLDVMCDIDEMTYHRIRESEAGSYHRIREGVLEEVMDGIDSMRYLESVGAPVTDAIHFQGV